jgi:hypothetical protein
VLKNWIRNRNRPRRDEAQVSLSHLKLESGSPQSLIRLESHSFILSLRPHTGVEMLSTLD